MTGDRATRTGRIPFVLGAIALAFFLLPGILGPYGFFIDELYYLSCSERLAWGYVDHPPLSPFLLRLARSVLGDGLLALRIPAALAGALLVAGTCLLARRLGGGRFAQVLAGVAILAAPAFLLEFSFYSMNPFECLIWLGCAWILVVIEEREWGGPGDRGRWWLMFGVVAGIGLLNKHTMVLFAAALAAALLATPARRHLTRPWIWIGLVIAALILLPNVLWQVQHGWPSLEFYRNADQYKNVKTPPATVLLQQVLFVSPATLPLWVAGIAFFLRHSRRRERIDLRHVGVLALVLLAFVVAAQKSRPDRIAGMYPFLFAAGGVMLERLAAPAGHAWLRPALGLWLAAWAMVTAPLGMPVLPPQTLAAYAGAIGVVPQIERGAGKRPALPQWFADRLGWEALAADVATARDRLSPAEKAGVVFFAPSYGPAGALEWLGREAGLRPVFCTHNTWFLWGPPRESVDTAIVLGNDPEYLSQIFTEVELAGIHHCEFCMPWRNNMPIWIARGPRVPIASLWPEWKHYE